MDWTKYLNELKTRCSIKIPEDHAVLITASTEEKDYKIVVSNWKDVMPTILDSFSGSYDAFGKIFMESFEEAGNMLVGLMFTMSVTENEEIDHMFSADLVELQLNNNNK